MQHSLRRLLTTIIAALLLATALLGAASTAHAQRVYVDAGATGAGDGTSWTDAYTSLQDALVDAELGLADEVWVAGGTYSPGSERTSTFLVVEGLSIFGGFDGTESDVSERAPDFHALTPTILDGDWDDDSDAALGDVTSNYSVVTITGTAVLDGVIVQGGNDDREPSAVNANGVGGGIKIDGGSQSGVSPTIRNTIIRNNHSTARGAGVIGYNAGYTLINVLLTENGGDPAGEPINIVAAAGGRTGLLAAESDYAISIINSTIAYNGGPAFFDAQAIASVTLTMENSIMFNNSLDLPENSATFQEPEATLTNVIFEQADTFCGVGGVTGGCTNVTDTDPDLRTSDGFLSLQEGSVALDFGDASLLPADADDLDGDGDVEEKTPVDGALRVRVQNDVIDAGWLEGTSQVGTSVAIDEAVVPTGFALHANYPNPFNPATTITYELAGSSPVRLSVFDLLGRELRVLVNENAQAAGTYEVAFDGADLPSGLYLYRLQTPGHTRTRAMLLLK